jgi:hypothetical protein
MSNNSIDGSNRYYLYETVASTDDVNSYTSEVMTQMAQVTTSNTKVIA